MHSMEMVYNEYRDTWNVFVDGEWYFEGTYEQCCDCMNIMSYDYDDDYYYD